MSNNNALTVKVSTVRDMLAQSGDQIRAALPAHMKPDRLARIAMTTFQRTPALLDCDPKTLVAQVIQCAQLGLEPDGILGGAYLVPFRNNRLGKMDCQLIVGYKGLIDLARRSGQVSNIYARVVYENEDFSVSYGLTPDLQHNPLPPAKRGKEKLGVYAVAVLKDGNVNFEFLYADEIEAIKKQSRASKDGPWVTHEEEMWKKTAIRRLAKTLPLSPEFAKAAAIDEQQEAGIMNYGIIDDTVRPTRASTVRPMVDITPPEQETQETQDEPAQQDPGANQQHPEHPGIALHSAIMEHCQGDMWAAEELCAKITEFRGNSLDLDKLSDANPKRCEIAMEKLLEIKKEK